MAGRTFLGPEELPKLPPVRPPSLLDHEPGQSAQRVADTNSRYGRDPVPWRAGAAGERAFAAAVDPLRQDGWLILHAVPCLGGDIDHLLIGERGVFSVNSKNLASDLLVSPGSVCTNWAEDELVPRAQAEAQFAARVLAAESGIAGADVEVVPVLVTVSSRVQAFDVDPMTPSAEVPVVVLELSQALAWFRARPVVLAASVASLLREVAQPERAWLDPAFDRPSFSGEPTRLDGLD